MYLKVIVFIIFILKLCFSQCCGIRRRCFKHEFMAVSRSYLQFGLAQIIKLRRTFWSLNFYRVGD